MLRLALATFILSATVQLVAAAPVIITFDELPNQPIHGVTFRGVTFQFTIGGRPSTAAEYNHGCCGITGTQYLQSPAIEGPTVGNLNDPAALTFDFAVPTSVLTFGLSYFHGPPGPGRVGPGFTVDLFDSSLFSIGSQHVNSTLAPVQFPEALFSYTGTPVKRVTITLEPATRFAVDNLTFVPVPEPRTGTMMVLPAALGGWLIGSHSANRRATAAGSCSAAARPA